MLKNTTKERRKSIAVRIGSATLGSVTVGGDHPVVIQSMTNTDTADAVPQIQNRPAM